MADVFISYSRRDSEITNELVRLLEGEGWSVWYDKEIEAGHRFRNDIEQAIKEAQAVIIIWSTDSVESSWVNAEAEEATRQNKAIPIRIDKCNVPFTLRGYHIIDFSGWIGDKKSESWIILKSAIVRVAGKPALETQTDTFDFIVGKSEAATHKTIQEAINAANLGQTIFLEPGIYQEVLHINKSVQIIGSGTEEVKLDSSVHTALNITKCSASLHCMSIHSNVAEGKSVINVDSGELSLREIIVVSHDQGTCIRAISRAKVNMWNCITDGGNFSSLGSFQSHFRLDGCVLKRNSRHGIFLDRASDLIMHNCKVIDSNGCGVLVQQRSSVIMRSVLLERHHIAGVEVRSESAGDLRFCQLRSNGQGIRVSGDHTKLTAESNIIESCEFSGMHILDQALVIGKRNEITKSKGGVIVFRRGNAELLENEIRDNDGHGIEVREGSEAKLTRNHLLRNTGQGIRCTSSASVQSFADYIGLSGNHGVCCAQANIMIEEATVSDSSEFGLIAIDKAKVNLKRVLITSIKFSAIDARQSSIIGEGITITHCGDHGIWLSEGAEMKLTGSQISETGLSALRIESEGSVSVTKSFIRSSHDYGIHLLRNNTAKLMDNIISDNKYSGICVEEGSSAEICGNLIEKNEEAGIKIIGKGGGLIQMNVIRDNKFPIEAEMVIEELATVIKENITDPSKIDYL